MGLYTMGVPENLVRILQKECKADTFVETGTFMGGTSVWASSYFKKVITIENSRAIFEKTSDTYKHIPNIDFLFGNSKDHLKKIVSNLNHTAIFWLDAHWSGGETYGINDECPLIDEIKIINSATFNHIILVDDARLFVKPPPRPHKAEQWANITQIISELNVVKNRYCFIADDVIGAVPDSILQSLFPYFDNAILFEQNLAAQIAAQKTSLLSRMKRKINF